MTPTESTKLALLENDVKHIMETTTRIESALLLHVSSEIEHRESLIKEFAPLSIVNIVEANDKEITELPYKMRGLFANIWTETYLKSISAMVAGSLIIYGMAKVFG